MDTIGNYKNRALATLEGNWTKGVIATLIVMILYYGVGLGASFSLDKNGGNGIASLWSLLCYPLMWGFAVYFLSLVRGGNTDPATLFDGYKDFGRIFLTKLLVGIYTGLWALLLIVPGIIKGISYSQTDFIMKDDPDIKYNAAIEKSMRMMQGHKMDYFLLNLSFIGWAILSVLTLGLGFLLLLPYIQTTLAHFYEDLKAETAE